MNITNREELHLSVEEQRETLLSLNYDKLYSVYDLIEEGESFIELSCLPTCLVAFENQIGNLQGLTQTSDISILDLKALTQGDIKVLYGPSFSKNFKKIVMCSGGMIDFFIGTNKRGEQNIHMLTSLRDTNAGTSLNQRTTVAGRCVGENIRNNIEIETAEEEPFLGKINGQFYLAIGNNNFDYLKASIRSYLENKYAPSNPELKKMFERGFRGIKYENLGKILEEIVQCNRFIQYSYKELNNLSSLKHVIKKVKIGNYEDYFYVIYNDTLNTYEFKLMKQFESFPEGFELVGKRPNRLFLESLNQYPRFNRIQNATKINPAGAIKKFTEYISGAAGELLAEIHNGGFVFSEGKVLDKNEDAFYQSENMLILSDGATDKSGKLYSGKTGGEIISKIIVSEAKKVGYNGEELINYLNQKISEFYTENNVDISTGVNIFSGTLVLVRITEEKIFVTQVGDSYFRINGKHCYRNEKIIDKVTSILRQKFILKFGESFVSQARDFILPILKIQNLYQNASDKVVFNEELLEFFYNKIRGNMSGEFYVEDIFQQVKKDLHIYFGEDIAYGVLDGINTPKRFVKEFEFDRNTVSSIEVFSDGYLDMPQNTDIQSWEKLQKEAQILDPFCYIKYPSTKSKDDRTIIIKSFNNN